MGQCVGGYGQSLTRMFFVFKRLPLDLHRKARNNFFSTERKRFQRNAQTPIVRILIFLKVLSNNQN